MPPTAHAAYRRALTGRQMEAQVFQHVTRAIAEAGTASDRIRAAAEARRLWGAVRDVVMEPGNELPLPLRAQIAGVAGAVLRECDEEEPDLAFVAEVTREVAAGLWN